MRKFEGGATRDDDSVKLSYLGFFDPAFLNAFAHYMHEHRVTKGGIRGADNWKTGFGTTTCIESLIRHFFDIWLLSNDETVIDKDGKVITWNDAIMGTFFNLQALWRELRPSSFVYRDGTPLREREDAVPELSEPGITNMPVTDSPPIPDHILGDGTGEGGAW